MSFSIVCLTYKRPELLEECVYSVLQQTYTDWEMIIVNDFDGQTIYFDHPQVKIFNLRKKFPTISAKRNFGTDQATKDFIIQLDDDDFFLPWYLDNIKKLMRNGNWLSAQRPIMYHEDPAKICLSPVPQTNAFVYGRNAVWKRMRYESYDTDEGITLNPFYERSMKLNGLIRRHAQLKPEQCGHVWRQDVDKRRAYSLAEMLKEKILPEEQVTILEAAESKRGDIYLEPKWSKDYTSIIVEHMRTIDPLYAYSQMKGGKEMYEMAKRAVEIYQKEGPKGLERELEVAKIESPDVSWQSVKPTWANAFKFAQAAKSRGLLATALDVAGVNSSMGDRVSDEVYRQRKISCFGDRDIKTEPCRRLKYVEGRGYFCGSCGCGKNDIARLDGNGPDEYTKLHYPKLECPLRRKGFSNEATEFLSVIIACLNEDSETLNNTIKSIRDTSTDVEIIVVDDFSDEAVKVDDSTVKVFRNTQRIGVAQSRHFGAKQAGGKYLLFTDSHMVFDPKWYTAFQSYAVNASENVTFCGVCVGLDDKHRNLELHRGKYHGARLSLWEKHENQVLEGKWITEQDGDAYEISCMMGACYFINREYFFKLRGLADLKMWGSDEPCLSLKILLSGGKILLMKGVEIGHIFRDKAPYVTGTRFLVYNKMRMARTLLPDELAERIVDKIPRNGDLYDAAAILREEKPMIDEYKKYYQSIFTVDINTICEKFNIKLP